MTSLPPHLYREKGRTAGTPDNVIERALRQIARTEAQGAGPILSLKHLAQLTGAPYVYLRHIVQRVIYPYSDVLRSKRSGGWRRISVPEPYLMDVQRVILHRSLRSVGLHPHTFAYREGKSIVDCARLHVGARYLIKFDLHNFFESIPEPRVFQVFSALGYSRLMSLELARICTNAPIRDWQRTPLRERYPTVGSYAVDVLGHLPQGAPTSGAIANVVATPMDIALYDFATSVGLVYTRYSDDLTFSGAGSFERNSVRRVLRAVDEIVRRHGFSLHRKKTRVIPPGARHLVVGLMIDRDSVRLMPEFRRRVEVHIRGVKEFGLAKHTSFRGFRSIFSFIDHVNGCLAFAHHIEPEWAEKRQKDWLKVLEENKFPFTD